MAKKSKRRDDRRANKKAEREILQGNYEITQSTSIKGEFVYQTEPPAEPLFGLPTVKCMNTSQKDLVKSMKNNVVTIASGSSGVGKTYIALLQAFNMLKNSDVLEKIVLVKSVTSVKGEEIGHLPGSMEEKMEPFMYSFSGNVDKMFAKKGKFKYLYDKGIIEIAPLAFVRGVNIDNAIVIIDELQNLTPELFKTIMTRIGNNSKYVFLGDPEQNDRSKKEESCMIKVMNAFKNSEYVGVIEFKDDECVRNPIIPEILKTLRENNL